MKKFFLVLVILAVAIGAVAINSYNGLNGKDEVIKSSWSEVLNQYQRRADLVPNLVETVKGLAEQEKDVLTSVTEARAKISQINISAEALNDPALLQQFQAAQGSLGSALSKLIAVAEDYPEIKSDGAFRDLQVQLEGTENRVAVARNRFIDATRDYNTTLRQVPGNLIGSWFGFNRKVNFTVEDEQALAKPPAVKLSD